MREPSSPCSVPQILSQRPEPTRCPGAAHLRVRRSTRTEPTFQSSDPPEGETTLKVLVTGGAGFIGSNFIRHLLARRADVKIINFDKLSYAGNPESLVDVFAHPRYSFVRGDISDASAVADVFKIV